MNAPPPNSTIQIDPQKLELARQIVDADHLELVSITAEAAVGGLVKSALDELNKDDAQRIQMSEVASRQALLSYASKMREDAASHLARLTREQLQATLDFYNSPTGKAYRQVTLEWIAIGISRQANLLAPDILRAFESRYCSAVACRPEEMKIFQDKISFLEHLPRPY